MLNIQEIDADR